MTRKKVILGILELLYLKFFLKVSIWVLEVAERQKWFWFSWFQRPAPRLFSSSYFSPVGEQLPSRYGAENKIINF